MTPHEWVLEGLYYLRVRPNSPQVFLTRRRCGKTNTRVLSWQHRGESLALTVGRRCSRWHGLHRAAMSVFMQEQSSPSAPPAQHALWKSPDFTNSKTKPGLFGLFRCEKVFTRKTRELKTAESPLLCTFNLCWLTWKRPLRPKLQHNCYEWEFLMWWANYIYWWLLKALFWISGRRRLGCMGRACLEMSQFHLFFLFVKWLWL